MGVKEREALYHRAIMEAYGFLWITHSTDKMVHAARQKLLAFLNKDEQAAGITLARNALSAGESR